jgi:hypothetical protein
MRLNLDWGPWAVKVCDRCCQGWPLANFHHDPAARRCTCTSAPYECVDPDHYDDVCICCRNTAKHQLPIDVKCYRKVRRTVLIHIKKDGFRSIRGWEVSTGLTVRRLTSELLDIVMANRCPHCGREPDGLKDITLDRRDRTRPLTRDNYQWLCLTCNKEKARTPEHIWEIRYRCWQIYVAHVEPDIPVQPRLWEEPGGAA